MKNWNLTRGVGNPKTIICVFKELINFIQLFISSYVFIWIVMNTCRLEVFDSEAFDKWVDNGIAQAIESSLKLYKEVVKFGFKVFLLTGRSEMRRNVTVENLTKSGFHDWDYLILRLVLEHYGLRTCSWSNEF